MRATFRSHHVRSVARVWMTNPSPRVRRSVLYLVHRSCNNSVNGPCLLLACVRVWSAYIDLVEEERVRVLAAQHRNRLVGTHKVRCCRHLQGPIRKAPPRAHFARQKPRAGWQPSARRWHHQSRRWKQTPAAQPLSARMTKRTGRNGFWFFLLKTHWVIALPLPFFPSFLPFSHSSSFLSPCIMFPPTSLLLLFLLRLSAAVFFQCLICEA